MYNSTNSVNEDLIDSTIIFAICAILMMFLCSIGKQLCLNRFLTNDSLPKYEEIDTSYCPECRDEQERTPPKYDEIV